MTKPRAQLSISDWKWMIGISFAWTGIQILLAFLISSVHHGVGELAYLKLNQWDSIHYLSIQKEGYHLPPGAKEWVPDDVHSDRANVGYFPAYPWMARSVQKGLGISPEVAQLLVSQGFCVILCLEFLLLLSRWGYSKRSSLMMLLALWLYPASFFLVMGYSESLFLASLLGVLLWMEMETTPTWRAIGMALSGFTLSATRLVGLPLGVLPLMQRRQGDRQVLKDQNWVVAFFVSLISLSGGLLFFLGCQMKFGHWDLYFKLQQLGWGNHPDFTALVKPGSYLPRLFFEDTRNSLCRLSNLSILIFFGWMIRSEIQRRFSGIERRMGYYFAAFTMFLICLAGKANYEMDSMIRYNLPVYAILLLAYAQGPWKGNFLRKRWKQGLILTCVLAQLWMIWLFTKGAWVA